MCHHTRFLGSDNFLVPCFLLTQWRENMSLMSCNKDVLTIKKQGLECVCLYNIISLVFTLTQYILIQFEYSLPSYIMT